VGLAAAGRYTHHHFVMIEMRLVPDPLVPLSVLPSRPLTAANGVGVAIGAALIGVYFSLTVCR
jgi:hypothetical protein